MSFLIKVVIGNPEGKISQGRYRSTCEDNIKMGLKG
jgi:hypothetical protein